MGLAEIEALVNSMNTPQNIFMKMDPTGLWGIVMLWGLFIIVLFSTRTAYERFSYSFAIASFITFVIATPLAGIGMITARQLLYFIVLLVVSIIYLYMEGESVQERV